MPWRKHTSTNARRENSWDWKKNVVIQMSVTSIRYQEEPISDINTIPMYQWYTRTSFYAPLFNVPVESVWWSHTIPWPQNPVNQRHLGIPICQQCHSYTHDMSSVCHQPGGKSSKIPDSTCFLAFSSGWSPIITDIPMKIRVFLGSSHFVSPLTLLPIFFETVAISTPEDIHRSLF